MVALRKESVDRNTMRRDFKSLDLLVALRKESVDRNYIIKITETAPRRSLSARRAWIEMHTGTYHPHFHVSLSARRAWIEIDSAVDSASGTLCRSPQGERG